MKRPSGTETSIEKLERRIVELRSAGRYGQALQAARDLLAAQCARVEAKDWEIEDARRLVGTFEHLTSWPKAEQEALAEADRLRLDIEALYEQGRLQKVLEILERDIELRKRLLGDEHPEVALDLNDLSGVLRAKGDYEAAERLHHEALAMRRRLLGAEHPDVAQSLHNLASLLWSRADYRGAEPLMREALAMRQKLLGAAHPDVAESLDDLGECLRARGDYTGAEPLMRDALAMRMKLLGSEHPDVAQSLHNLATLLHVKGDAAGAEPLQRGALAMWRKLLGAEHPDVAASLNNLAVLLRARGDYGGAEPLLREVLAIWRNLGGAEHPNVATSLNNLAVLLRARGDYLGAEPLQREALTMQRKLLGTEHPHLAAGLNNLAELLKDKGDYAGAESLHREALAMYRTSLGPEHPDVAMSMNNLAVLLRTRGDYVNAEALLHEALAMRRRLLGDTHPHVLRNLHGIAVVLRDRGAVAEAEKVLAQAAEVYEAARLRAGWGLARAMFEESPNPGLAALRLRLGRNEEAWPAVERSLGRVLAELLAAAKHQGFSAPESARLDKLGRKLTGLEKELAALAGRGAAEPLAAARTKLLAVEAEWSAQVQAIAEKHPVTEGRGYPLERVQGQLGARRALVGWLDVEEKRGEWRVWAYVIRASGPVAWVELSAGGQEDAREQVRRLRGSVSAPGGQAREADELGRAVWEARLAPLAAALSEVEDLVVMPSGAMLGVPVEALVTADGTYAGERYRVSYTPSATVHTWLKEVRRAQGGEPRQRPSRALLVGDPPFSRWQADVMEGENVEGAWEASASDEEAPADGELLVSAVRGNQAAIGQLPRLVGSRREVGLVAKMFKEAQVLLGREASEEALVGMAARGELGAMEVIHLATHALVDEERPGQSALVLSQVDLPDALEAAIAGTRIYDGLVRAGEVVREWRLNAELVVLSACETGLGKKVVGEGYVGFAHAFLQAGARSVLVSLWKVDDEATGLLMRRFYEGWLERGLRKAEALRQAKRWLRAREDERGRQRFAHPYYWSAFVLIGAED